MYCKLPAVLALATFFFLPFPSEAQHGGGGGHGFGGFSGHSAGHSVGHSIGHSFGHVFGFHSGRRGKGALPGKSEGEFSFLAGAAMIHGKVVELPGPRGQMVPPRGRFHRQPITEFGFSPHRGFFPFPQNSGFGFCAPFGGSPVRRFLFGEDFDCFQGSFIFDPFFLGGFLTDGFDALGFGDPPGALGMNSLPEDSQQPAPNFGTDNSAQPTGGPAPQNVAPQPPDTLLQLLDGSMYGLTNYWVEGERLHYITNYGGENSVPLAQIDFEKTIQLNASQGTPFKLHPKPSTSGQ
jgi:hypothetical protein